MNYELAKKLKEAGFPQEGEFVWIDRNLKKTETNEQRTIVLWKDVVSEWEPNCEILCYNPTLSELIYACSKEVNFILVDRGNFWECGGNDENEEGMNIWGKVEGKTPEEAVANLWLSLNK